MREAAHAMRLAALRQRSPSEPSGAASDRGARARSLRHSRHGRGRAHHHRRRARAHGSSLSATPASQTPPPASPRSVGATATPSSSPGTVADSHAASHSVPHSAIRKRIAEHMVQSLLHTAPHVTTVFEADMTAVMAHRAQHQRRLRAARCAAHLHRVFPGRGGRGDPRGAGSQQPLDRLGAGDLRRHSHRRRHGARSRRPHRPGAARTRSRSGSSTSRSGLHALVTAAREGKLQPADVRGGTFTISNHGVSGSLLAAPIVINQPQSAILGVGKLEKRPVVVEAGRRRSHRRPAEVLRDADDRPSRDGWPSGESLPADVRQGAGGVAGAVNVWPRIDTALISTHTAIAFLQAAAPRRPRW